MRKIAYLISMLSLPLFGMQDKQEKPLTAKAEAVTISELSMNGQKIKEAIVSGFGEQGQIAGKHIVEHAHPFKDPAIYFLATPEMGEKIGHYMASKSASFVLGCISTSTKFIYKNIKINQTPESKNNEKNV